MNQVQLNEIAQRIDLAFGQELSMSDVPHNTEDSELLNSMVESATYQDHLQDQVNRHIIRAYLLNAVVLDTISDENFSAISKRAATCEGRASLSLHMLMSSVEAANDIYSQSSPQGLEALRPGPGASPHMAIVRN